MYFTVARTLLITSAFGQAFWYLLERNERNSLDLLLMEVVWFVSKWYSWGPPGSCRPQMGPCWAHEHCYQGGSSTGRNTYVVRHLPLPVAIIHHFHVKTTNNTHISFDGLFKCLKTQTSSTPLQWIENRVQCHQNLHLQFAPRQILLWVWIPEMLSWTCLAYPKPNGHLITHKTSTIASRGRRCPSCYLVPKGVAECRHT